MSSVLQLPTPLRNFFSYFPLRTYPPILSPLKVPLKAPTIWIHPPRGEADVFSSDVECLKWQAYLALRGLTGIAVRWDVSSDGGVDGRLPNLQVPLPGNISDSADDGELLAARMIPSWVDAKVEERVLDSLEGYKDVAARDESRAWVALLEGNVHAALVLSQPPLFSLFSLLSFDQSSKSARSIQTMLSPPPPPLSGLSSLLPLHGARLSTSIIESQYREAISSLSERLGTDKWFLGSDGPTALDALVFAYLHSILHSKDSIRIEVTRRVNLVAWEWRVRSLVRAAFVP